MADLEPGLYDQLIDELLHDRLGALNAQRLRATIESVDSAEMADRIGEVVGRWARDALAAVTHDDRADAAGTDRRGGTRHH